MLCSIYFSNIIQDSSSYGIYISSGSNSSIYNNLLNNTNNVGLVRLSGTQYWNITRQTGTRIYSLGNEIGGNYYTNPSGNGYSDTCDDNNTDGICDSSYILNSNNTDYLPLTRVIAPPDSDGDGICDLDDACPLTYGTWCHGCPQPSCDTCKYSYCPSSGMPYCKNEPNGISCSDELFCNGEEVCQDGICVFGIPPTMNDGINCTDDSCDEINDKIIHMSNDANCNLGQTCNPEIYSPPSGCGSLMSIHSPVNKTYDSQRLWINVTTNQKMKYIYRALNSKTFSLVCRDCDSYSYRYYMREGLNNLTIKAVDYEGNKTYENVIFTVDSKEPVIIKIEPKNKEFVKGIANFTVTYDEDSVKNITLFYGTIGNMNQYVMYNCTSGRDQECTATRDLKQFDNQTIQYYFVVYSYYRNGTSSTYNVTVDNKVPLVTINSPENKTYNTHSIKLNATVSEHVKLMKSVDGGRFATLCNNCNLTYTTSYFRDGIHNVTFLAVDKAGNEGYASAVFTVKSS
jgi:hypothetical protein